MANAYLVVPDLEYRGHAKQVSLLAPALRQAGHTVGVYALEAAGPFADVIRAGGVCFVDSAGSGVRSWRLLRRMIHRRDAGVVHAFGLRVLRRLWAATLGTKRPRIVLSLSGRERLSRLDRRCVRVVSRVLVPHATAAQVMVRQGVPT